jgi:hypothetical protein
MRDLRYLFSVDIKSKKYVKNISISDEAHDRVFFEADLGLPISISLINEGMLEFEGSNGILRMTMSEEILQQVLSKQNRLLSLSS